MGVGSMKWEPVINQDGLNSKSHCFLSLGALEEYSRKKTNKSRDLLIFGISH